MTQNYKFSIHITPVIKKQNTTFKKWYNNNQKIGINIKKTIFSIQNTTFELEKLKY